MEMSPGDVELAMSNAEKVRKTHPVQGMQVTTYPDMPRWVQIRFGRGAWRVMPANEALAYTHLLRVRMRNKLKGPRRG